MIEPLAGILSLAPFVARRTVAFADCDPAGVMFAGNYYAHALWAYDLYLKRRLGGSGEGVSAPMKAATLVHHAPLRPADAVDFHVAAARVGTTTFGVTVRGRSEDRPIFDADLTLICMPATDWRSCPVPAALRRALLDDGALETTIRLEEEVR